MASEPRKEHSFIVDSFEEFEALARRALHKGKPCKMMSIGLQQICFKSWKQKVSNLVFNRFQAL